MAILDTDQITEIQLLLQEDATWSNGLWTTAEVLGYFNQRQHRFLKETRCTVAWRHVEGVIGDPEQDLPEDWVCTIDMAWVDDLLNRATPLCRADQWEIDHLAGPTQAYDSDIPVAFRDGDTPSLTMGLFPAPTRAGRTELFYVSLAGELTGAGIDLFTVPDEFVPYVKYGVLADMLGKDGRGQDLQRSRYCEGRYQEGLALAQALLEGF